MAVESPGVRTREEDREASDARVIARSRDEPEHFAALFDRYADAVHRYAARRIGPEAAEDLMAETFTTAFQRRHTYDLTRADARPSAAGLPRVPGPARRGAGLGPTAPGGPAPRGDLAGPPAPLPVPLHRLKAPAP